MAHDAKEVANYFLALAEESGVDVDPMKLQKLVYYAHGWHLALTGKPLIAERVEAWPFGPVVPSIYHEFKHFGRRPIIGRALDVNPNGGVLEYEIHGSDSKYVKRLLDRIWKVYGRLSGIQLSKMTHQPGTAWHKVWVESGGHKFPSVAIDDKLVEQEFASRVRERTAREKEAQ